MTPTDYALALRVRDGDDWAFEELLRRHADILRFQVNQFSVPGEERDDFEQAARIGLLKAAKTFTPDRGPGFCSFAKFAVRGEIITALNTALRGKHRPLNGSVRFEQEAKDHSDPQEPCTVGELIPGPESDDPCEILLAREEFARQVTVLTMVCSEVERTVVERRLNGLTLASAGEGLGRVGSDPEKVADNALSRVRRRLARAA